MKNPFRERSEFFRNVLTVMSGTTVAQLIPIAISPVLSRLYSPEDFAAFAYFTVIASLFAVIITFRYELSIMLPDTENKAVNVVALCFVISVSLFLIAQLIVAPFVQLLPENIISSRNKNYLWLIPAFGLFAGGTQVLNYWISRQKKFQLLAAGRVIQTSAQATVGIGFGLLKGGPLGLVLASVGGQMASFIAYAAGSWKKLFSMKEVIHRSEMKEQFQRYRSFMYVNTPHSLLGTFLDTIVIVLLTHFFNPVIVGLYGFGYRLLKVPSMFIGNAVFQVFFQNASMLRHEPEKLHELTKKLYRNLALIGAPIFVGIMLFAPPVFAFVFGEQWREAGHIAQILSPWLFLNFMTGPIAPLGIVLNKQKQAIWFTAADMILRSIAIIVGGWYADSNLAFTLLAIMSGSVLVFALIWFYRLSARTDHEHYEK